VPAPKKRKTKPGSKRKKTPHLPSKQDIIKYLDGQDGRAVRRDIARAFNVKGDARTALRKLLKEMDEGGLIDLKGGKRISKTGDLPPVAPVDVMSVDDDGDLLCMPAGWRGDDEPPMIRLDARAAAKQKPPPGVGDRLLVRLKPAGDGGYEAQIIRAIGKGAHRFLAVYRKNRQSGVA